MSVTEPPIREGASFTDARTCREWLGSLPMTNIPNAQYQVLSAMRAGFGGHHERTDSSR